MRKPLLFTVCALLVAACGSTQSHGITRAVKPIAALKLTDVPLSPRLLAVRNSCLLANNIDPATGLGVSGLRVTNGPQIEAMCTSAAKDNLQTDGGAAGPSAVVPSDPGDSKSKGVEGETQSNLAQFADCMARHGVNVVVDGAFDPAAADESSSKYQAAQNACLTYLGTQYPTTTPSR